MRKSTMKILSRKNIIIFFAMIVALSCSKKISSDDNGTTDPPVTPPVDPATAGTIGFFLDPWSPVSFTPPAYTEITAPSAAATAVITVDATTVLTKISPALFGNNANTWSTQMVTEPVLLGHMQKLKTRIIRAPGGSISDVYFWNAPSGQFPADVPSTLMNADGNPIASPYWSGKNPDAWTMTVDNYYNLIQQTGNTGIIAVNYAYARYGLSNDPVAAAAHLAADWVRYDNGRTKYWEIGNENGGSWEAGYRINTATNKDGQPEIITGALYGKHFRVFSDSMKKAASEIGKTIYIGAQLLDSEPASWATSTDKTWNQGVLTEAGNKADFFIVHNYFTPYNTNSNATDILKTAISIPSASVSYVQAQMAKYNAPVKPVALTEWNIFAVNSKQSVSHVTGMHLVMTLNELMKNKFGLATRWDLANGWNNGDDHGLFSRGETESGETPWSPRPAFYHQYFFQKMLGDRCINASAPASTGIAAYASTFSSGEISVTLANTSVNNHTVQLDFKNFNPGKRYYWYTLSGSNDNGEFSRKVTVNNSGPAGVAGGPADYATLKANSASVSGKLKVTLPARSIVFLVAEKK